MYCGHSAENPFPRRPINAPLKPHSYDLYGDRTADILEKKKNSSLAYEYKVLAPALSYFFDAKNIQDSYRESLIANASSGDGEVLEGIFNSYDGIFDMLSNRWTIIKLRARAEAETGGMSEDTKLLLDWLESKTHGFFPGEALLDSDMDKWIKEYHASKTRAQLNANAKKGAAASSSRASKSGTKSEDEDDSVARTPKTPKKKKADKKAGVQPKGKTT